MTGEEALAYIREWLKDEYALNYKDKEALNKAIEALEQEYEEEDIIDEINKDPSMIEERW